jgi:hypothetical protein
MRHYLEKKNHKKGLMETIKEKLIPTLLKLFHETERAGTLPNSFYEVSITHPKTGQGHNKKKRTTDQFL